MARQASEQPSTQEFTQANIVAAFLTKLADVVAFTGNPLERIELMESRPIFVMMNGQPINLELLGV
jgi:hypothetical protein